MSISIYYINFIYYKIILINKFIYNIIKFYNGIKNNLNGEY